MALLNGTSAWHAIENYQQKCAEFIERVALLHAAPKWATDISRLRWAWVTVHSRSLTVFKPHQLGHPLHAKPFMAPGADFLNHNPDAMVDWKLRSGTNSAKATLQIATQQAYPRAGLEVFNQYAVSDHQLRMKCASLILYRRISEMPGCSVPLGSLCPKILTTACFCS